MMVAKEMPRHATIKVELNIKGLKGLLQYEDWSYVRNYYKDFIDDCLLSIKVNLDKGQVLNDKILLDDKQRF